jgi:hypothetical protein
MGAESSTNGELNSSFQSGSPLRREVLDFSRFTENLDNQQKLADLKFIAGKCFSPDGKGIITPLVNHTSDPDAEFHLGYDFLREVVGEPDTLNELFGPRGNWIHTADTIDPISIDPTELMSFLRGFNRQLHVLGEHSPDAHSEEGYNRHGDMHTWRVSRQTLDFLTSIGASNIEKIIGVFGAGMHDVGYPFAKEAHALVGANMTEEMFPRLKEYEGEFWNGITLPEYVRRIIENHDSDVLRATISSWARQDPAQIIEQLANYLGKPGLALFISDKMDIGRDRISWQQRHSMIRKDKHAEVNFLGQNAGIGEFGDHLLWKLKFTPDITDKDRKKYPGWAVRLSEHMQEGSNAAHFYSWISLFWEVYSERTIMMVEAALALFPRSEGVEVQFVDEKAVRPVSQYFNRGTLAKDFEAIRVSRNIRR